MDLRRDSRPLTTATSSALLGVNDGLTQRSETYVPERVHAISLQTTLLSVLRQTPSENSLSLITPSHALATASSTSSPTSYSLTRTRPQKIHLCLRRGFQISQKTSRHSTRRDGRLYIPMALTGTALHAALAHSLASIKAFGPIFSIGVRPDPPLIRKSPRLSRLSSGRACVSSSNPYSSLTIKLHFHHSSILGCDPVTWLLFE